MHKTILAALLLGTPLFALAPQRVLVCVTTVKGTREQKYRLTNQAPKPDALFLHAQAQQPTTVVLAGFEGRKVSKRYQPRILELAPGQDPALRLPAANKPTRLFVVFLPPASEEAVKAHALLVNYAKKSEPGGPVAARLYDQLTLWSGERTKSSSRGGQDVKITGGVRITSALAGNPSKNSMRPRDVPMPTMEAADGGGARPPSAVQGKMVYNWRAEADEIVYEPGIHGTMVLTLEP